MNEKKRFEWPYGARAAVSVSFDDARQSQLDVGLAILNRHNVHATFYMHVEGMWRRQEDWRRVVEQGHEIGNHTVAHPCSFNFPWSRLHPLEEYNLDMMEDEIYGSNHQIQSCLGVKPVTFAYPCGQTFVGKGEDTKSYIPLISRYFLAGRGVMGDCFNEPARCDLANLASIGLDKRSFETIRTLAENAAASGEWAVFHAHDVGENGFQTINREELEKLCAFLKDAKNKFWVDTVAAVAGWIQDERRSAMDFARI